LRYSHDETTAERIGLAVLHVAGEAPAGSSSSPPVPRRR
jgi:hypothetical protein